MVSKIKYETLPSLSIKGIKEHPAKSIFLLLAFILVIISEGKALFYIFMIVVLYGILKHVFYFLANRKIKK